MNITLSNSLSRKKELFIPLHDKEIHLYVCGITPYDFSHLGHARSAVNADILVRLFKLLGYKVIYIRNYTDIDDKLLKKAEQEFGDQMKYKKIAEKFIDIYEQEMQALNCLKPTYEPRVTEHIVHIIEFIKDLVAAKKAYIVENDVYFDIKTFPTYGKLSGKNIDDLEAGARVDIDSRKKNPGDFALWKGTTEGQFWQSPWGWGRPGWHIECSAMAKEYFGETIDIHGGGMDLIFPHHENEIAQSESLHQQPLANYWVHNAFITIKQEKMSKSLGNVTSLKHLFATTDPMIIRYFILQHHYRTPIDLVGDDFEGPKTAYKKLINHFGIMKPLENLSPAILSEHDLVKEMIEALCDDLNTPKLLGLIFQNLPLIKSSPGLIQAVQLILIEGLGLKLDPLIDEEPTITPEIEQLIKAREEARLIKDWKRADELRQELQKRGFNVQDKKLNS